MGQRDQPVARVPLALRQVGARTAPAQTPGNSGPSQTRTRTGWNITGVLIAEQPEHIREPALGCDETIVEVGHQKSFERRLPCRAMTDRLSRSIIASCMIMRVACYTIACAATLDLTCQAAARAEEGEVSTVHLRHCRAHSPEGCEMHHGSRPCP